jgi:HEAT repeat protein
MTLVVLVAFCGILLWAARSMWESLHPVVAAAERLQAQTPLERQNAMRDLVQLGLVDTGLGIPPVIASLDDADPQVRAAAAEALNTLVSDAVTHGKARESVNAAVKRLCGALDDREPSVRVAAAKALGYIAFSQAGARVIDVDALIVSLAARLNDSHENVRLEILAALANRGHQATVAPPPALVAALNDKSAQVRAAAVRSLASFPCPLDPWVPLLFRNLEASEPRVRTESGLALGREKPPAVSLAVLPELIAGLASANRLVSYFSARALLPHAQAPESAQAIPAILSVISNSSGVDKDGARDTSASTDAHILDHDPVQAAVELLGKLAPGRQPNARVIPVLTDVLRSGNPRRRAEAACALGHFGPAAESAVPTLIGVFKPNEASADDVFHVDDAATDALARIAPGTGSEKNVVTALIEALNSTSRTKQLASITALPKFRASAKGALPRLRELQNKSDDYFKEAVSKTINAIEDAQ